MVSKREQILQAVFALLPTPNGAQKKRNAVELVEVPAGGLIVLRDGSASEPDVFLSPLTYVFEHQAEIEVLAQDPDADARSEIVDGLVAAIRASLVADRSLGGLADWTEVLAPELSDEPVVGDEGPEGVPFKVARLPVRIEYTTADSTG